MSSPPAKAVDSVIRGLLSLLGLAVSGHVLHNANVDRAIASDAASINETADLLLESAGRPDAIASDDLEGAVGLTQILAETATSLLGMHVDVAASERLTRRMQRRGATRFAYTNVDRDGMLEGPDPEEVRRVSEAVRGRFLYSGGIASVDDLLKLRSLRLLNLAGVIAGKALYEGRFSVREGQAALS